MFKNIYFFLGMMVVISLITSCISVLSDKIPAGGINTLESSILATTTAATSSNSTGNIDDLIALVNQYVAAATSKVMPKRVYWRNSIASNKR